MPHKGPGARPSEGQLSGRPKRQIDKDLLGRVG